MAQKQQPNSQGVGLAKAAVVWPAAAPWASATVGLDHAEEHEKRPSLVAVLGQAEAPVLQAALGQQVLHQDAKVGCQQAAMGKLQPKLGDVTIKATSIKEATSVSTRASRRLVGVADANVMDRAKKRAAWKNLEGEGNPFPFSLYRIILLLLKFQT